jgi:hypothetical protein
MMRALARGRRAATLVATAAAVMVLGQSAQAVPVYIDGGEYGKVVLFAARHTRWDVSNDTTGCGSGDPGYSPVYEGQMGATSDYKYDAFDGGLLLLVGPPNGNEGDATRFVDSDNIGQKVGEQLTVGPELVGNLLVTRTERALPGSPTLRSLVALRNPGGTARTRDVYWHSDLGSDGQTGIRRTSNGSADLVNASRWVVTSDSPTSPSDPVLTHVLWGKRAGVKTAQVLENPNGTGCLTVRFRVRVPKKSTRYLLFFTEMNVTNPSAVTSAGKFNRQGLNKALLAGIGPKIRSNILNWDLP